MVTALREDVWWIDLFGVNAYLVDDGDDLTLVDAGMPWHRGDIAREIRAAGASLRAIDRVFVTHFDLDHVGGLGRLDDLDATVYVGAADAPFLTRERRPPLFDRKGAFQLATDLLRRSPDLPVERVEDGDEIGSFTAYHTPGHTPGHTAFVSETLSVGFLGDLVRESGGDLRPSPWFLSADVATVRGSVRDLVERAPRFEAACVGHGTPFERGGSARLADCAATLG